RGGQTVLGQLVEPAPRGKVVIVVRRAWARAQLPVQAKAWERAEAASTKRARAQRQVRLEAWKRERLVEPGPAGPIVTWIDRELDDLKNNREEPSPLLVV